MNIAALRTRITFQKNTLEVDEYRNHGNTWEPWFSCYATVSKTGKIYNIIYIDPMAFKGSSLKFRCETERRNE